MKLPAIVGGAILGVAVGYAIHLLRHVAINTAVVADILAEDHEELVDWLCACDDDEACDQCRNPAEHDDYQLGDADEQTFRGIIETLGPEEVPDGE